MLGTISQKIDQVVYLNGRVLRWLAPCMVAATLAVVILRYVFEIGAISLQESLMYMHGLLFLLGIPVGIQDNSHVRVDIIYSRLQPRQKHWIDLLGHLLFMLPIALFIFITSLPYVAASWRVLEGSAEVGGIPGVFLLKTVMPVAAVMMMLQTLSEMTKLTRHIRAPEG